MDAYVWHVSMPRPRSDEKRSAALGAATRIIVTQGLSEPTAEIAKEAGVANGSLFTYFAPKPDLFNQLYVELKAEMAPSCCDHIRAGDVCALKDKETAGRHFQRDLRLRGDTIEWAEWHGRWGEPGTVLRCDHGRAKRRSAIA